MQGENGKKKRFDQDFKVSAVKMITEGGHKAAEVARSLGIHPTQLYSVVFFKPRGAPDADKRHCRRPEA